MRRRMCSQTGSGVDVVGICSASARMVLRKTKGIEILVRRYDREDVVVVGVGW